jgi:hypothetical protein
MAVVTALHVAVGHGGDAEADGGHSVVPDQLLRGVAVAPADLGDIPQVDLSTARLAGNHQRSEVVHRVEQARGVDGDEVGTHLDVARVRSEVPGAQSVGHRCPRYAEL